MSQKEQFYYDNGIVRKFAVASIIFGVVGMLVGLWAALELIFPSFNLNLPFTTFGRIRPLHTNAVIFAFVGNAIFAGVYYSIQRLLKTRLFSDVLSNIHFWGWQLIILAAAITLPLGYTSSYEYAELEWPIDIAIAIVWVIFGINMIGTMVKRREAHLYVAIWFYIATWVTVTVLHVVNNLEVPYGMMKSYPLFAGVQAALVQWWYGHNAVAFFLTTPYLGLMYYFLPKAANRPVYSYRLSIIHFWSLIFLYIWAGPHHLLYSSLPDWAQSLGTVFSLMLIAPSWGGMLNGLLTLRGAWDRVSNDPILKFMVVAVTAYGMSTFEGPMLSIKSINAISHFTDWTIAHVHIGTLGWNGFLTFGMMYWMLPRIFGTKLYSVKLANTHFWVGTMGILFYSIPLYWAAWTQNLMWEQFTPDGRLANSEFIQTVTQILPMYRMRAIGATLYFTGLLIFVYNIAVTMKRGKLIKNELAEAAPRDKKKPYMGETMHRLLERKPVRFTVWALIVILIGGMVEIIPMLFVEDEIPKNLSVKPYTPLELTGRDIFVREGCVGCHSQMIRPFRSEVERYDPDNKESSKSWEYIYDRPFLWGSKRTGPDLHREGLKATGTESWHFGHMYDPRSMIGQSIMPAYPWLYTNEMDVSSLGSKIRTLQLLGTPYSEGYDQIAEDDLRAQAKQVTAALRSQLDEKDFPAEVDVDNLENLEIIALIAYLRDLGTDIIPDEK